MIESRKLTMIFQELWNTLNLVFSFVMDEYSNDWVFLYINIYSIYIMISLCFIQLFNRKDQMKLDSIITT